MAMMRLWVGVVLALVSAVVASDCPGGLVRCPDFMTCCELANKEYGCCPFPNAMCCKDFVHCCPQSMECDIVHQSCQKNGFPVPLYWKAPIHPELIYPVERTTVNEVVHEATLNEVVDKATLNEVVDKAILNEVGDEVFGINKLDQFREGKDGKCLDGRPCPDTFTCCQMHRGGYGCCPFSNAQCCSDGYHCCPSNAHCNITTQSCEHNQLQFSFEPYEMSAKPQPRKAEESSQPQRPEVSDPGGKCPDGHPCPEKYTCCKVPDQGYGCCPYQDAVCCTDFIHCCPKGTNCNTTLGTCDLQITQVPAYSLVTKKLTKGPVPKSKIPSSVMANVTSVVCPDERYQCPDGSTCCQLNSGAYGCCPLDQASCCSDHEHCCPHGYTCIPGGCSKTSDINVQQPQHHNLEKKALHLDDGNDVVCPDQTSSCPDNDTCCDVGVGLYGCCPMPEAACCDDKRHCCPNGYKCSPGGCVKDLAGDMVPLHILNIAQQTKDTAQKKALHLDDGNDVVCPDQTSSCPDNNTCCDIGVGLYGCCPMPEAACCDDKRHCCPNGYKCSPGGCVKDLAVDLPLHILNIAQQTKDTAQKTKLEDVVCPDKSSRCPPENTCCEVEGGGYGCCPMAEATCCGDLQHCCPHGFWCTADGCDRVSNESPALPAFLRKTSLLRAQKPSDTMNGIPNVIVMP